MADGANEPGGGAPAALASVCPRCHGDLTPGGQACGHCGAELGAGDSAAVPRHELFEALRSAALGRFRDLAPGAESVACRGCGAVTLTTHRAQRCPFCGGALVLATTTDGLLPDAVAPFAIEEGVAAEVLHRWLGRRWFAPSDLSRAGLRDALQAVYLPYWSFTVRGVGIYVGERGDAHYSVERRVSPGGGAVEHRVRHVKWRRRHGQVERELDDFLVPASTSLPPKLLDGLAPWRAEALVPFSPSHLHGTLAERYSIDLRSGFAVAQRALEDKLRAAARFEIGGDEQRVSHLRVRHEDGTFRHLLLPVWSTALRYRGRVYRLTVNAQTGAVSGERPYSRGKLAAAAALALLLIAAGLAAWLLSRKPAPEPAPEPAPPPTCAA